MFPWEAAVRTCRKCRVSKPITDFYVRKYKPHTPLRAECKDCTRKLQKKYRESKPDEVARSKSVSMYKLSKAEYDRLHDQHNGLCGVCKNPQPPGRFKRLCIDHDHATNNIRGLLCNSCNMVLGKVKDSPELLRKLAEYVELHRNPTLVRG